MNTLMGIACGGVSQGTRRVYKPLPWQTDSLAVLTPLVPGCPKFPVFAGRDVYSLIRLNPTQSFVWFYDDLLSIFASPRHPCFQCGLRLGCTSTVSCPFESIHGRNHLTILIRVSRDSSPVVRSTGEDILPRKMTIIDVPQRVDARDTASSSSASLEARDPLPEVERIVRRYPRRIYQDFYEKRSPSPSPDDESSPPPVARSAEVVERRFPRRALYERHEARSNPAPPEARSDPEPSDIQRRYPRKVYADYYQKRESSPPIVEARDPAPELTDSGRRFPRRVYAEHYEKRQEDPAADPAPATDAPADTSPVEPTATTPTVSVSASVSASASTSRPTSANVVPAPLDVNAVINKITSEDTNSYAPGTTIKETTLFVNKITHISDKGTNDSEPVVPPASGTEPATPSSSPATPSSSASATSSTDSAAPSATPTAPATGDEPVTPPPAAAAAESTDTPPTPPVTPTEGAADPSTPSAAPADEATTPPPVTGGDASRRSLGGSNQASRQPIIRRQLGYSGPAWASHLKRNVNN